MLLSSEIGIRCHIDCSLSHLHPLLRCGTPQCFRIGTNFTKLSHELSIRIIVFDIGMILFHLAIIVVVFLTRFVGRMLRVTRTTWTTIIGKETLSFLKFIVTGKQIGRAHV